MADYSLDQLIEWMKLGSRLSKWGMISCMDRTILNTLLTQEYIRRFKTTSYLPPVSGSIPNGDQRFALNNFALDRPRLSFENVDLNDSKARLRMNVVGGTQLGLKNVGGVWYTREVRETSPLQGPELSLNLRLGDVPGTVGGQGELRLDLKHSDDFRMTVSDDRIEQTLVGAFFQQKFAELADEKRVFPIGRIEQGDNELLQPQSFVMRTQARRRTEDDPEGAVLGFVRWQGDSEGDIPGPNSDFRYLIPKDGDHSASVLFDPKRVMLAQLLRSLSEVAQGVEFDITRDSENRPTGATAKSGKMQVPEQRLSHEFDADNMRLIVDLTVFAIDMEMDRVLNVSLEGDTVEIEWTLTGVLAVQPHDLDSKDGRLKPMLEMLKFDLSDFKKRAEDTFEYVVRSYYKMEDVEGGRLKHIAFELIEIKAPAPAIGEIKQPPREEIPPEDLAAYLIVVAILAYPLIAIAIAIAAIFKAVSELEIPSVESILRDSLERDFGFAPSIQALIHDTIKLNFGNAIVGEELHSPRDIGFFGQINPESTRFVVNPLEHNLVAGTTQQFAAVPAASNLSWSVEPVLATVLDEQIGTIDPTTGLYTAPAADTFEGPFVRVRVTAVNQDKSFSSSALITVLKRALQVNPLAYVVQAKGKVNLEAGYLGDPGKLRWALKDPAQGGVLAGAGLTAVYTAPEVMPPSDPDDPENSRVAYIVEEVELSETTGGLAQIGVVIAESGTKAPMLVTRDVDLVAGTVALEAVINGRPQDPDKIIWAVLCGPGSIDPNTGVYTPGSTGEHAFALLTATFDTGFIGVYEGYVLQPLPLASLEDAVLGTGVFADAYADRRAEQ
ncbi:hypothetical protein G7009_27145 [Pseudomonas capeferrum]|uniref:Ig-like domain-containing protein n=1 Tax=Pseudomonas capeferrum TaxID=1495066 RepID=UPI0015E44AA3|nr:hypothetical protein [Pseudomonas capeferrum]MBA1205387.1 hypothetical protein [Pseudomonas capeferrum]